MYNKQYYQSNVIGVIVAMDKEFELIENISSKSYTEYVENHKFLICEYENLKLIITASGIGKVNAAMTTMTLIHNYGPCMIISSGVCGGLKKHGMKQGDLVIGSKLKYHDVWCGEPNKPGQVQGSNESFRSVYGLLFKMSETSENSSLTDTLQADYSEELKKVTDIESNIHYGTILTGDWFVDTVEKAKEIKSNFPEGIAIDMESTAIAQVCYKFEQPSSYIRIVSDVPLSEDEEQRNYENFWSNAPVMLNAALRTFLNSFFVKK